MLETHPKIYVFDEFQIDTQKRLLWRAGRTVPLTAKAFDLLLVLVENQGREVTKQDLMERIWADQIVEEGNLTVTMSYVRKALGEKAGDHRFIVTIPGRGYRFVAQVTNLDEQREFIIESKTASQVTIEEETSESDEKSIARGKLYPPAIAADVDLARQPISTLSETGLRAIALKEVRARDRSRLIAFVASIVLLATAIAAYYIWIKRTPTGAATQIKSIAVLPFKPLLAESRDESLELGMADTLITRLSNIREINVRPISSVRKYTALEQDPIAAGREQRVDAVLDGQIQKAGDKVRITVRLLRIADGAQMWASQFDEKMTDIFAVEDSISQRVTSALALTLTSEEQRELRKRYTADANAYQLYLKGRYQLNRLTDDGFFKGRDYFQQAIDKDPNYGLAYAGLADAYNQLGGFDALPSEEAFPKAREAAEQALKLDERLAEAHSALAVVKFSYDWDFAAAEREFQRALDINPNYSDAHKMNSYYLTSMGRFEEAIGEAKRAQELDPISVEKQAGIGEVFYFQRQYDQAIEQYRKALEMDTNSGFSHWALGRTFTAQGKYNAAIEELKKAIPLSGDSPDEPAELARTYALAGKRDEALKIVDELRQASKHKHVAPTVMAAIYGALGDKRQAFAFLDKAFDEREFILVMLNVEPMFDPLRADPRFDDLSRRVGFIH
jgi:DNA-binding winged helix-turn-helix (wHTH) protein/TolB-like protein/Flp pilus assembly protein TadD